ncbi:MAG: integrase [Oleispira sp.]|nr:integrase [Oleispira sp.]
MILAKSFHNRLFLKVVEAEGNQMAKPASPDIFDASEVSTIPDDFVLCRDSNGLPTAVYGNDLWDFRSYRLAATGNCRMNFSELLKGGDLEERRQLVNEVKRVLFSLMYFVNSGVLGPLSITTLLQYYQVIKHAAFFCAECKSNRMLSVLGVKDLLSNKMYLGLYVSSLKDSRRKKQKLSALLNHLNTIGKERLGYAVVTDLDVYEEIGHKQHPIIPTRIYLEMINVLTEKVEFLKSSTENLEKFLKEFSDPFFGVHRKVQRRQGVSRDEIRPSMPEAISRFGLVDLFTGSYEVNSRAKLNGTLTRIQFEMKLMIHLYTGMRNDEVNRLPYSCVVDHVLEKTISDKSGNELVPSDLVSLLSTTTKLEGYLNEDSWYAHPAVLDAVEILRRIVRGYAATVSIDPEKCPLLVSTVRLFMKNSFSSERLEVTSFKLTAKTVLSNTAFRIMQEDYDVLCASDPVRDFSKEQSFQVGQQWPLTTHQFRRSLAFYAVNSGFVSLPTLKKQFKHLSQEMTKYYSRNNQQLKTVFGHYDTKEKQYILPLNHIAYEVQVGMPLATAEALLSDLLEDDVTLYGKSGGYIEKQRDRLRDGEVLVEEFVEKTADKVRNGEISYRKTLLGGCTNAEICECSILGEFSDCLFSKCSVIKSKNLEILIESTERELQSYEINSVEYLSTKSELDELIRYKKHKIDSKLLVDAGG